MSPEEIQKQLQQKAADIGQRSANPPAAPNFANDSELGTLRGQHADKIKQLFAHDTQVAQVNFQPQEAPGPHAEGYTPPESRIIDPLIGQRASSMETQATAGELGDIMSRISQRKDLLSDAYTKGMDVYKMGIEATKMEFDALSSIFDKAMKIKDFNASQEDKKNTLKGNTVDINALLGIGVNSSKAPAAGAPMYTPKDPSKPVQANGKTWKYDPQAGQWQDTSATATTGGSAGDAAFLNLFNAFSNNPEAQKDLALQYAKGKMTASTKATKPPTKSQVDAATNAQSALENLDILIANLDKKALLQKDLPFGMFNPKAQALKTAGAEITDVKTRIRTGAALNANEQKFYDENSNIKWSDTPENITLKLTNLKTLYTRIYERNLGEKYNASDTTVKALDPSTNRIAVYDGVNDPDYINDINGGFIPMQ